MMTRAKEGGGVVAFDAQVVFFVAVSNQRHDGEDFKL